jgi:hypothetical protein
VQADLAHLLAEAGHHLVGDRERRLGRDVPARGPGAAGGQHQVAAAPVDEVRERRLDHRLLVGDEALLDLEGRRERAAEPLLQRGQALVLVHAARGAVADRDEPHPERTIRRGHGAGL